MKHKFFIQQNKTYKSIPFLFVKVDVKVLEKYLKLPHKQVLFYLLFQYKYRAIDTQLFCLSRSN